MTAARISAETLQPAALPRLVVELPSPARVFFSNVRDLIFPRRPPRIELYSAPAPFWPDVFVKRRLPWFGFLQSAAWHVAAFTLLVEITRLLALQPHPAPRPVFDHSQVIYYSAAEYLPPLDTRVASPGQSSADPPKTDPPQKADPEFSRQPIISLPPEAENRSQTVVTPPNVKLKHEVKLPNMVEWSEKMQKPQLAIPAPPLTPAAEITRIAPAMQDSVVAPPPSVDAASDPALVNRKIGELNMGRNSVIAPAPQLPVAEQRAFSGGKSPAAAPQVVPPPPTLAASEAAGSPGRVSIIALNLHPSLDAPPDPPEGNRRGTFAATPEGHPGASGSAGSSAADGAAAGENGTDRKGNNNVPAGLYVGSAPASAKTSPVAADPPASHAQSVINPTLTASLRLPHASNGSSRSIQPESRGLSEVERAIFLGRRFYSLTLNLPNLNSAGGSWIVRFAELHPDPNSTAADLSPPVATLHVDPGYPLQLMRENVAGTVILYAIIHTDGTVGNVRVLRSVDPRLDQRAREAVAQWQFQPAKKNGVPVEVEATFQIPFRPSPLNGY